MFHVARTGLLGVGLYALFSIAGNSSAWAASSSCQLTSESKATVEENFIGDMGGLSVAKGKQDLSTVSFNNAEKQATSLADWKGRVVLLNLWATWCAPCLREMPALDKLQAELGGEDFEVVAVSIDMDDGTKPRDFYAKNAINNLAFYHDRTMGVFGALRKIKLARGMPATVLVGPDGCALAYLNGPAEWAGDDAFNLIRAALVSGS